jgi:hypothetical protein
VWFSDRIAKARFGRAGDVLVSAVPGWVTTAISS